MVAGSAEQHECSLETIHSCHLAKAAAQTNSGNNWSVLARLAVRPIRPAAACPEPRVKRAFPEGLLASPVFTRVSGQLAGKCPIDKGYRSDRAGTPKRHGLQADESLRSAASGRLVSNSYLWRTASRRNKAQRRAIRRVDAGCTPAARVKHHRPKHNCREQIPATTPASQPA